MTNPIGTNSYSVPGQGGPSLRSIVSAGEGVLTTAARTFGATTSLGAAAGVLGGSGADSGAIDIAELLTEQTRIQQETQAITLQSNVSHTEHEARMSVVRNTKS